MYTKAIDTDSIGKYIGVKLYRIALSRNVTQASICRALKVHTSYISSLMTGAKPTANMEKYWEIAREIGIGRDDFDALVVEARKYVLGTQGRIGGYDSIKKTLEAMMFDDESVKEIMDFIRFKRKTLG